MVLKIFRFLLLIFLFAFLQACEDRTPSCEITYPEDKSSFGKGDIINIMVDARDPNGNNLEVRFYINDEGVYSTTNFPYHFDWDTDGFEDGEYLIQASVIDNEGKKASDSRLISISLSTPRVETKNVLQLSLTSATVEGAVKSDGGAVVTETGFYWSSEENSESTGKKVTVTSSLEEFSAAITGLNTNSSYYYRAYAKNSEGESIGEERGFTTLGNQLGTFIDPRDDREYKWVRIGNQTWMAENLAYLPEVYPMDDGSAIQRRYYVYGYSGKNVPEAKENENFGKYGVLYNWIAALNAPPPGWHLPTDEEWKELERNLGMSKLNTGNAGWRGSIEGRLLKSKEGWHESGNGSDISDFTAKPGGYRIADGEFRFESKYANFWTATEYNQTDAWNRHLYWDNTAIYRGSFSKRSGYAIRCLKD
jgi:uncharacterized protein (TIGR02145 family)